MKVSTNFSMRGNSFGDSHRPFLMMVLPAMFSLQLIWAPQIEFIRGISADRILADSLHRSDVVPLPHLHSRAGRLLQDKASGRPSFRRPRPQQHPMELLHRHSMKRRPFSKVLARDGLGNDGPSALVAGYLDLPLFDSPLRRPIYSCARLICKMPAEAR